uniref:Tenascin N n=1 Tax=Pelodiscus sinensis TaxID=13735 RepID=K7G3X6_PELSI
MSFWRWLAFPQRVLLYLALQTTAAQLSPEPNCTSNGQKISFSHSYKIDLPKSSQLQVEADPLPLKDDSHVLLAAGGAAEEEEQNIIFRHNIRVQTPRGDCEALGHIRDLLGRVEKMEKEMLELKEACSTQRCCGGAPGVSNCSGHGTFIQEICGCDCEEGWEGSDCSRPHCPNNCHGHGRCVDGRCLCSDPYVGEDCGQRLCPANCSSSGVCSNGVCQCYEEFIAEDCSEKRCPNDCSGNGFCDSGECYCHDGFIGLDCSQVVTSQNVQLLKTTEDSLTFSWDEVPNVDYYLLSYYPIGHEASAVQVRVPKGQLSYEIPGLRPSTKYQVALRNVKKGISSNAEHLQARTALSAVSAAWVTEEMEDSLEVEWENPPTEPDYFKLRYSSLRGQEKEVVVPNSNDPKSRYIISGLKPGTEYNVTVVSVKDEIEGKPSTVTGQTGIDSPTNLETDRVTEDIATISWNRVLAPIDRYMVSYTSADGDTRETAVGKDQSSTTLTGLKPGMEYVIHIWAEKGGQQSRRANTKAVTEMDSPTKLETDGVTEDTATISWNRVLAPIDRYMVSYTSADGNTRETAVGKDQSSTTLTGLKSGMEYVIHIWAEKGGQQSKRANTKAVTAIDSPTNLVTDQVTEDTATISWKRVQAPIDRYMVRYISTDGNTRETAVGKDQSSTTLTGLKPGMEYIIHIWAEKGGQQSKRANTKAVTDIDSPTNLVTDGVTEDKATISWKRVQAPIDRYVVSYTSVDGDTRETAVGKDKSITTLTGLKPGMEYVIYIWAEKRGQQSRRANTKAVTGLTNVQPLLLSSFLRTTILFLPVTTKLSQGKHVCSKTKAPQRKGETKPESKFTLTTSNCPSGPTMLYSMLIWVPKGSYPRKHPALCENLVDSSVIVVTEKFSLGARKGSFQRRRVTLKRETEREAEGGGELRERGRQEEEESHQHLTTLYAISIAAPLGTYTTRQLDSLLCFLSEIEIDPPKNLRVSDVTQSSGIVTWMPPAAQINGYTLTYQAPNGTSKEVHLGPNEQRFTLEGLEQGVRYTVYVMAFKGDRRSRKAASIFSTVGLLYPYPADCSQTQQNGNAASGMYTIYLNGDAGRPLQVFCDMATDGGGWIVFQRRNTGQLDFYKRWRNYVEGFGDPLEEFWLGLDKLHNLTSSTPVRYEIRVDLRTSNDSAYAVYDSFQVASSRDKYKLSVGNYRGTAGDALTYHNGWKFTTWDRDNDVALSNCARSHHGAWWYKNCHLANLNGKYGENKHSEGVNWAPWKGHLFSIPYTEMKIRPQSYSSEPILGRKKRSPAGKRKKIRA